jgi:hypothetical protein
MHHLLASYKHMLQCQQQTASHVQVSSCMGPADLAIGQLFVECIRWWLLLLSRARRGDLLLC